MIAAKDCQNLQVIRAGIDAIDRHLISLLQQRLTYVLAASQFKPDVESIPAPERVDSMLMDRLEWAKDEGIDPPFVIGLFRHIIPWYIDTQIAWWRKNHA
ncbi:chorismate mutase family protein [Pantoea sp. USHLN256]|uniref:chorismate mutase family protein n=1 Tax=Pantoea sp. USHLN256 TaxID=3081293 RepID=UPI0030198E9A